MNFKERLEVYRAVQRLMNGPRVRASKYLPHQGINERTRRLWQVHEGQLHGAVKSQEFVTDEARHMAHGILPPTAPVETEE